MNAEARYIQFPLFLIRGAFENREAVFSKLLKYGIYRRSTLFKNCAFYDVGRQLIYDLYNDNLGTKLKNCITALNSDIIGCDEDYRGFIGGEFNPTDEISELLAALRENSNFKMLAIEHYQMHLAFNSLNIKGNIENNLKVGKEIQRRIPEKEPMPMLSTKLVFDYRDNDKSEFEIAQLLAYMAIKSILGERPYFKTNKKLILSRMFGFANHSKTVGYETELFKKYATRYHIDRVLRELELSWHVKTYSDHMRGFFVSVGEKVCLNTLASVAEDSKRKNRIADLKKKKAEAKKRATTTTKGKQ